MKVGFHIPASKDLKRLTNQVEKSRGNAFQFYSRGIKGIALPKVTDKKMYDFWNFLFDKKISTVIMHAPYAFEIGRTISSNLAVPNPEAVKEVLKDLEFADMVRAKYYVVNAGYSKEFSEFEAYETLKSQLLEIIESTPWKGEILIRNSVGGGTALGGNLHRWNEVISFHERVRGALDFGRAYSYGYTFLSDTDANEFYKMISEDIGWGKIPLIYINDSNRFSGSKREDTTPLGDGVIGFHGYDNLLYRDGILNKVWLVENQPETYYYDRSIDYLMKFHKD